VKSIREIGRQKIEERLNAIKNGDPLPNDILANVIQSFSNFFQALNLKLK
jgi:hypothetical protein